MSVPWVQIVPGDISALMSTLVQAAAGTDAGGAHRNQAVINLEVERVRGAILSGNRVPLSKNPKLVPPSGRKHTVALSIASLIASTPNMDFASKDNFAKMVEKAEQWLKGVQDGDIAPEDPTDPDPTTYPANWLTGGQGGEPSVDLSTEGGNQIQSSPAIPVAVLAPARVRAIGGLQMVMLGWDAPETTDSIVTFNVYRGLASGQEATVPIATALQVPFFSDAPLDSNVSYYYVVSAVANGQEVKASEVVATTF